MHRVNVECSDGGCAACCGVGTLSPGEGLTGSHSGWQGWAGDGDCEKEALTSPTTSHSSGILSITHTPVLGYIAGAGGIPG